MTALTRTETVALILDHAENQGLNSYRYVIDLACMSDQELATELDRREAAAVDGYFDMPQQYDAFGVNTFNSFNTPSN